MQIPIITRSYTGDVRTDTFDYTGAFMTENGRETIWAGSAANKKQIRVTHSRSNDFDAHFSC